jgi:tetratricopeptide (TPR) repeat protein
VAFIAYTWDWDWPRAEREFQLALKEGSPWLTQSRYGWSLATRGRFDEARQHLQAGEELDPLNPGPRFSHVLALYLEHKYPEAKEKLNGMLVLNPDSLTAHIFLGVIATLRHDCAESTNQAEWVTGKFDAPVSKAMLAFASACRGERSKALEY